MKRWRKLFYLTLFIHFVAFATVASTHVANDQDEISKEKLFAEDVAAAEVTVENIHETPLASNTLKGRIICHQKY